MFGAPPLRRRRGQGRPRTIQTLEKAPTMPRMELQRRVRTLPWIALLAAACTASPPDQGGTAFSPETGAGARTTVNGVTYDAQTEQLAGDTLRTRMTLSNECAAPVELEMPGGCPVLVRAYAAAARTGDAAWDQGAAIMCTMELRLVRLAPGASETLHSPPFTAADLRAAGVPAGRYYLTGVTSVNQQRVELSAGMLDL
jgi:hypothetical protein